MRTIVFAIIATCVPASLAAQNIKGVAIPLGTSVGDVRTELTSRDWDVQGPTDNGSYVVMAREPHWPETAPKALVGGFTATDGLIVSVWHELGSVSRSERFGDGGDMVEFLDALLGGFSRTYDENPCFTGHSLSREPFGLSEGGAFSCITSDGIQREIQLSKWVPNPGDLVSYTLKEYWSKN